MPDRWMRPLHRGGPQLWQAQGEVFALEVEWGCGPGPRHYLESFGHALACIVAAQPVAHEVIFIEDAAAPDADVEPPLAEIIEQGQLGGEPHGMAQSHLDHGEANADALRAHRQGGRKGDRGGINALAG